MKCIPYHKLFILIICFLLYRPCIISQIVPELIKVDVNNTKNIPVSVFADNVSTIHLRDPKGLTLSSVSDVINIGDRMFLKALCLEFPKFPKILMYTKDGTFIKEIGLRHKKSGDFLRLKYLIPDYEKQALIIKYAEKYARYDSKGNLISVVDGGKGNVILSPIFNKHNWSVSQFIDIESDSKTHFLIRNKINGSDPDTLYKAIASLSDIERGYKKFGSKLPSVELPTQWAIINDKLFVSLALDDAILKLDNSGRLNSVYKFELLEVAEGSINRIVFPRRFITRRFIFYGYNINHGKYYYVYDIYKAIGTNTILRRNNSGELVSGIYDDILNTGFIHLKKGFNSELFFTKENKKLEVRNFRAQRKSNITLFIIEPKD